MSTSGLSASPEETKGALLDTAEQQAEWIRRTFIDQTRRLVEQGFPDIAFLVIGQGIETMGAFLDRKPFRAKGQSRERFSRALSELFPPRYAQLNGRDFLYRNLRSSLTHLAVGSPHLWLVAGDTPGKHLWVEGKKTTLVLERLLEDYCAGWETIIARLTDGTLRVKPLAASAGE